MAVNGRFFSSWSLGKASMALMEYRNTPLRDLERTPAQLLYGRHLRDLIQIRDEIDGGRYNIQEDFQLTAEDRERAYFEKIQREGSSVVSFISH